MSAQALLSVTALVLPAAPQATADVDASGFGGLLDDVMEGADAPKDARPDQTVKGARAQTDVGAAACFLVAPVVPPVMTPVPTAPVTGAGPDEPTDSPAAASGAATGSGAMPPLGATPVPPQAPEPAHTPSPRGAAASDKPASAESSGETPVPVKGIDAPALPQTAKAAPAQEISAGQLATKAASAALELAMAASKAPAPVAASPVAQPVAPAVPVAPPPLRALAQRTSSPLEPEAKTSASTEPSKAAAAAPAAGVSSAASDQPVKAVEAALPAQRDPLAAEAGSDDPVPQAPGPTDAATAQTRAIVHETAPSQISRASLEATAQIAAQIVRKLEGRSTRFEMALTPDDLGRVDVKLDIDADGRLAARLAFDNPLAATDLKGRADELRRQLQEAGFQLADNALEFADRDSSSSAFDRGGDARKGQNRAFAAATRLNAEIDVAQPPRWMALSLSPSGLDLKV